MVPKLKDLLIDLKVKLLDDIYMLKKSTLINLSTLISKKFPITKYLNWDFGYFLEYLEIRLIRNFKAGFTLIELLVSISIVGLIFGIVITSSAAIQKNSRNTRRQADLQIIQGALQQYYADQFVYPEASFNLSSVTSLTGSTGNPPVPSSGKTYLQTVPKDPISSNDQYCYRPLKSDNNEGCINTDPDFKIRCNKYELYTQLEEPGRPVEGNCNSKSYNKKVTL